MKHFPYIQPARLGLRALEKARSTSFLLERSFLELRNK